MLLQIFFLCFQSCQSTSPEILFEGNNPLTLNNPVLDKHNSLKNTHILLEPESEQITLNYEVPVPIKDALLSKAGVKGAVVRACAPKSRDCFPSFPVKNQGYFFDGVDHYSAGEDRNQNNFVFINDVAGKLKCFNQVASPFPASSRFRLSNGVYLGDRLAFVASSVRNWQNRLFGQFALLFVKKNSTCHLSKDDKDCPCSLEWSREESFSKLQPESTETNLIQDSASELKAKTFHAKDLMSLALLAERPQAISYTSFKRNINKTWPEQRLLLFNYIGQNPWSCDMSAKNCVRLSQHDRIHVPFLPQSCAHTENWLICLPYPGPAPISGYVPGRQIHVYSRKVENFNFLKNPEVLVTLPQEIIGARNLAIFQTEFYIPVASSNEEKEMSVAKSCEGQACSDSFGKQRIRKIKFSLK
ncbi:MAG: hypothetical protein KBD78_07655 [Oligoflexales bacterium]|nr:hypothetical protein [Oligoflexales bacterium]